MPRHFLIIDWDGRYHQVHDGPDGQLPYVANGQELVEVDRHTTDPACEHWDKKNGRWVLDEEKRRRLDFEVEIISMPRFEFYQLLERMMDKKLADLESRLRADGRRRQD